MDLKVKAVFEAIDRMSRPVLDIQNKIDRLERSLKRTESSGKKMWLTVAGGAAIATAGIAATAAGLGIAEDGIQSVTKAGASFEDAILNAGSKMDETIALGSEGFKRLSQDILETGKGLGVMPVARAQVFKDLTAANFQYGAALKSIMPTINAATANNMEAARAAQIAADVTTMFGYGMADADTKAREYARTLNVLSKAANISTGDMESMYAGLVHAGALGGALKQDIEDVAALSIIMESAGVHGEKMGTALKGLFLDPLARRGESGRLFDQLGITTVDKATGKYVGLINLMGQLQAKLGPILKREGEFGVFTEAAFGKEGIAGLIAALGVPVSQIKQIRDQLKAATEQDYISQKAKDMRSGFTGAMNRVMEKWETTKMKFFEIAEPSFVRALEKVMKVLEDPRTGAMIANTVDKLAGVVDKLLSNQGATDRAFWFVTQTVNAMTGVIKMASSLWETISGVLDGIQTTMDGIAWLLKKLTGMDVYEQYLREVVSNKEFKRLSPVAPQLFEPLPTLTPVGTPAPSVVPTQYSISKQIVSTLQETIANVVITNATGFKAQPVGALPSRVSLINSGD